MKKVTLIICLLLPMLLLGAAVIGYQDWQLRGSAPGNPASGFFRVWADNTGQYFKCLTNSGSACYFDPKATSSTPGIVEPDNSSITVSGGVISASSPTVVHVIGATFDGGGSALTTGTKVYEKIKYSCTIQSWGITVDTGTITIDVWKTANGSGIPTSSNSITASATPAIASGTDVSSTTLTGWTTSISTNDNIAFDITAVASATKASLTLQCQ